MGDWIGGRLFVAVSIICGAMATWSAAHAEFAEVAAYFYCSLVWFDTHLKNQDCIAMIRRMEAK